MDINGKYWNKILDGPWEPSKLTYHFKNKHDEQAWMTPVEKSGPGSFFGNLDLQQAWMTPVEKLKFVSPFGTFKKNFQPFLGGKIVNLCVLCFASIYNHTHNCGVVQIVTLK